MYFSVLIMYIYFYLLLHVFVMIVTLNIFFPFIFNLKCLNEGKAFWYSFNTCSRNLRHFVPSWLQKLGKKKSGSIVKKKKKKKRLQSVKFFSFGSVFSLHR